MTSPVIGAPSVGQGPGGRPRLGDLRSHLTCVLCAGYFIDATTIVECLHTFCRSCILRHLEASGYCPICEVKIHRTKASSSLRADRILQTLVYKMVPDLFMLEMQQRRNFYEERPYADPELPSWARGDVSSYVPHVITPDEHLHIRLELFDAERCDEDAVERRGTACGPETVPPARYLRCPAGTPLSVLHKFISTKFQLPHSVQVQLISGRHVLPEDVTLMDLGYMGHLTQEGHSRLSFRLLRGRKRPAVEESKEITPVKSARLEASSAKTAAVVAQLPKAVPVIPIVPGPASSETAAARTAVPDKPRLETPTISGTFTAERSASPADSSPSAPAVPCSPSPATEPALPSSPLCGTPAGSSPRVGTTTARSPGPAAAVVSAESALGVAVTAETMFDPDDEEQTSPQIVQDIIASLVAEEECRAAEGALVAADGLAGNGTGLLGTLNVVEDAVSRKSDEDTVRQAAGYPDKHDEDKAGVRVMNDEANVLSRKTPSQYHQAGKAVSERTSISQNMCRKHDLQSGERLRTADKSVANSTGNTPRLDPAINVNLKTSESTRDVSVKCAAEKASNGSIKAKGVSLHAEPKGTSRSESPGQNMKTTGQTPTCVGHTRVCAPAVSIADSVKHSDSKATGQQVSIRTSEALIEKRCYPSALSAAPNPSRDETPSVLATIPTCSTESDALKTSSLPKEVGQDSNTKQIKSFAPSVCAKEEAKAQTTVQGYMPGSSPRSSETNGKHGNEKSDPISRKGATGPVDGYKRDSPSPASKTSTPFSKTSLKIPKTQTSIHNIVRPAISHLRKQKHAPVPPATKPQSPIVYSPVFQRRCRKEADVPVKRAKIHQNGSCSTTPLDLSNPSKKTVAADSTSMLSRSPVPSPKPNLPKLKTGKSQNIHSIVDSLASREHLSFTAVPTVTPSQPKNCFNHSNDSQMVGTLRKSPSSPHLNVVNVPRKTTLPNTKTTSGSPRNPSHYPQPAMTVSSPMSPNRPLPMSLPMPESASCYLPPGGLCSPPLHVDTSLAGRLNYDLAMRNLLTLSHMAMAQGGLARPPHMFPMQSMFPPRPKSHEFPAIPDPSLLRQPSEARMGAASKKASPTAGTTAPQLRTPTGLTSASIQHMEDLTRTVGKRTDKERNSVTVTPIPFKG